MEILIFYLNKIQFKILGVNKINKKNKINVITLMEKYILAIFLVNFFIFMKSPQLNYWQNYENI